MKIIGAEKAAYSGRKRVVTLQLEESVLVDIDKIAQSKGVARQRLINAILKTAIKSSDFSVDLDKE